MHIDLAEPSLSLLYLPSTETHTHSHKHSDILSNTVKCAIIVNSRGRLLGPPSLALRPSFRPIRSSSIRSIIFHGHNHFKTISCAPHLMKINLKLAQG